MERRRSIEKPVRIFSPDAKYTADAKKARIKGNVIVRTIIDKEGCITHVEVLKGLSHGLTESAVAAIKQYVYRPATRNGEPVAVYFNLSIDFQLEFDLPPTRANRLNEQRWPELPDALIPRLAAIR